METHNKKIPLWKIIISLVLMLIFPFILQFLFDKKNYVGSIGISSIFLLIILIIFYKELKKEFKNQIKGKIQEKKVLEFKKEFKRFFSSMYLALICLLIIVMFIVDTIINLLSLHIGIWGTVIAFVFTVALSGYFVIFLMPLQSYNKLRQSLGKKPTRYSVIWISFVFIILFISAGFVFLSQVFVPTTEINFNMKSNNQSFDLNCNRKSEIVGGVAVICIPSKVEYKLNKLYVNYTLENAEIIEKEYDNWRIQPPAKTSNMKLVADVNLNNKSLIFSNEMNAYINSHQESNDNKKTFITFFLGLFAIAFFTIPNAIKNIRDLVD